MKRVFPVWFGMFLLLASACAAEPGKMSLETARPRVTPESLPMEADTRYAEYLHAAAGNRSAATEKTAAYLRTLPGVKGVTVRGSDSLLVIMEDGNELFLMLGRERL
ncbi:MAG: hypothetical protein EHM79_11225 [Geobacter sp.]|nr:MAG: hypothetical protein EHM79_11225 [Geobacter sp.]